MVACALYAALSTTCLLFLTNQCGLFHQAKGPYVLVQWPPLDGDIGIEHILLGLSPKVNCWLKCFNLIL